VQLTIQEIEMAKGTSTISKVKRAITGATKGVTRSARKGC